MQIKRGDLFQVKEGIIAHGCNAQGVMGKGVALQVKTLYPKAYTEYERWIKYTREHFGGTASLMGQVNLVRVSPKLFIANCVTQYNFAGSREDTQRYVSYDAVDDCFVRLADLAVKYDAEVHFPLIGGGLANGDHNLLRTIYDKSFPSDDATLWIYE